MLISQNGISLIKSFEHLYLKAYDDGGGVWTIGWGHIKGVKKGQVITVAQAEQFLLEDLREAEADVNAFSNTLTQNQYDALVSVVFNCGGSFLTGFKNEGNFCGWISDNGIVRDGLLKRRCAEAYIYKYGFTPKILKWIAKNAS